MAYSTCKVVYILSVLTQMIFSHLLSYIFAINIFIELLFCSYWGILNASLQFTAISHLNDSTIYQ